MEATDYAKRSTGDGTVMTLLLPASISEDSPCTRHSCGDRARTKRHFRYFQRWCMHLMQATLMAK